MMTPRRVAYLVAVALIASAGATAASPRPVQAATRYLDPMFNVDVRTDVAYGSAVNVDGQAVTLLLDVYTPRNDTASNRPVFIWAHGGYFFLGSKETEKNWAIRMAQRGYVTASINYRLSSTPVTSPVDSPREVEEINDAREDMQTAVRWFRAHAAELRIDPDRIAVGGSSAGAVTALGVAVNNDDPPVTNHPGYSSAVCTAVSFAGANEPSLVDLDDAGAIFHHGTADTTVPYELARQTYGVMVAQGVPSQFWDYEGEGHSLSDASYDLAVDRTIQWLYERVATVSYPCSNAVRLQTKLLGQTSTQITATPARSAVVSLVGVDPDAAGYVQTLPCGTAPGSSSNLNLDATLQTRSVLAIVPFDSAGRACLFNQPRMHLVADVQGYFAPGAFDDGPDERILDTRFGAKPGDGSQTMITGRPGQTAVVSIVMTETTGAGYLQVLPCGATPGASSNMNSDAAGQTRTALAFVRFDASGTACIFLQRAAHVVVDAQGYMTSGSFDDADDTRLLDTRGDQAPKPFADFEVFGRPNTTAVVSLVAADAVSAGFLQFHACNSAVGQASNLNVAAAGQTIAGLAFVHFEGDGRTCLYSQAATTVVVDVQGYLQPAAFDDVEDVRVLDTRLKQ